MTLVVLLRVFFQTTMSIGGGHLQSLPIENVWGSLKYYLRHQVKPTNQETLVKGISDYWQTLTPDSCTKYISHLKKVIPKVVSVMGAASGY